MERETGKAVCRLGNHVRSRALAVGLIAATVLLVLDSPARAHTDLESSDPADAETVEGPISDIELVFTRAVTPVGEGFVVLDGDGAIRAPTEVVASEGRSWTLRFAEPLRSGPVGVRWSVQAADNHRLAGSLSFTIDTPTQPEPTPTPTQPAVDAASPEPTPTPTQPAVDDTSPEPTPTPTQPAVDAASPEPTPTPTQGVLESSAGSAPPSPPERGPTAGPVNEAETIALDVFLNDAAGPPAGTRTLSQVANLFSLIGAILGLGAVAFIAWVVPDPAQTPAQVDAWSLRSGAILATGAIIGLPALVATNGDAWSALWAGDALWESLRSDGGVAWSLRLIAGLLLVNAFRSRARRARARTRRVTTTTVAATACILGSFALDGHTASEGPRWLHTIANVAHVAAAATWAGGLAMVTATVRHKGLDRPNIEPAHLAARFSVVASVAVVAVAVPGIGLAIIILDHAGDLTTEWGRILIAKVSLVAVAAGVGAYNHKVVVPALAPGSAESGASTFRKTAVVETTLLLTVGATTALLVTASTIS